MFSGKIPQTFFWILLIILLSASFMFITKGYELSASDTAQNKLTTERQLSENIFSVDVWVFLSGRYNALDLNARNEVVLNVTVGLVEPPTENYYFVSVGIPFSLSSIGDLPQGASYTYGFWGVPPLGIMTFKVPANVSYFTYSLRGYLSGLSVFWRNTAEVLFTNATSTVIQIPTYRLILVPPSSARVLSVFSRMNPNLRYQDVRVEGQRRIITSVPHYLSPIVILYETETWETYALILMLMTIFSISAVPYILKSKKRANNMVNKINETLRRFSPSRFVALIITVFKKLYARISMVDSSKLLYIYILCALLMVSLSFSVGPDPRLKVYVLSSTPENAKTISDFVSRRGVVTLTVYDEMSEFELLASLRIFSTVVVGDFFLSEDMLRNYIYPALDSVKHIIIMENYAYDVFSSEVIRRYPEKYIVVENLDTLGTVLRGIQRRPNALGLEVSPTIYLSVVAIMGLLSFVLVFLGAAFLASKLIEVGKKPKLLGFPEVVVNSALVFVFTQVIYLVCSVVLAIPLGLHTSSPKVTAVGFLGFGGGSRPRLLSGFSGFIFGSLLSMKEGPKLNLIGFLSFVIMSFFVLIDPITGGVIFYEFILLFTVGPGVEFSYATWSYVRMFLASVAEAFGGWITPVYGISLGTMLYYAGAIPFGLFTKLQRTTATILLLSSAFFVADGGMRVADMMPWKTFASLIPGVMAGLFFAAAFYSFSIIEMIIRTKIERKGRMV